MSTERYAISLFIATFFITLLLYANSIYSVSPKSFQNIESIYFNTSKDFLVEIRTNSDIDFTYENGR